jgi:hypothetical protein
VQLPHQFDHFNRCARRRFIKAAAETEGQPHFELCVGMSKRDAELGILERDITLPDIVVAALRECRRSQLELRMRLGLGKVSDEDDLLFPTLEGSLPSPRSFSANGPTWLLR